MKNLAVLSGDNRQVFAADYFNSHNYMAYVKNNFDFSDDSIIICNTPFSKNLQFINCDFYSSFPIETFLNLLKPGQIVFGGSIPFWVIEEGRKKGIVFIDVLNDDDVVWFNAALTAEGIIANIILNTNFSLCYSNVLIMGYGKCGTNIASRLSSFKCNITIHDHTPVHLSQAASYGYSTLTLDELDNHLNQFDIIINTVPNVILTEKHMKQINKNCVMFEIASKPYGLDKNLAHKYNLSLITCPGLPGATAPKSAGELIAKSIISYLERTGINGSQL